MPRKWSKEIVVVTILTLRRGGEKLNSDYAQKNRRPLYLAACIYWGGWKQAIEGAGLSYYDVRIQTPNRKKVWDKDIVVETIKRMHNAGEDLNSNYVQTKQPRLYAAANKYFGGWPQAVIAAGLDYETLRKRTLRAWSKVAIVEEIIRRSTNSLSIRGGDVTNEDRGIYSAARRHFGEDGWAKARMLAGFDPIDPKPQQIWSKETVIEEILRLYENGVALNAAALAGTFGYIRSAGAKYFMSWGNAIRAAGLDYSKIRKMRQKGWWTKPRILMAIRSFERRDVRLSSKAVQGSHGALFAAALTHFGAWSQAVEAAGISYQKHSRTWSTKAWLRRMDSTEYKTVLENSLVNANIRRKK